MLPSVTVKRPEGVSLFMWSTLTKVDSLGSGSYSNVHLYKTTTGENVALKLFRSSCSSKAIYKEAVILKQAKHPNIVNLLGLSSAMPDALMLEYVSFDLCLFGSNTKVSSLSELLSFLDDNSDFHGFEHIQMCSASGIIDGLSHLHSIGIAHRDLKPQNILVSNQHYSCDIATTSTEFMTTPVVIKLTDFGESRSTFIQTNTVTATCTTNLYRGSPVYMAPEILEQKYIHVDAKNATLRDLKAMDVWSMAMVFHMLLNPDLDSPYQLDLLHCYGGVEGAEKLILNRLRAGKLPTSSTKYEEQHNGVWKQLMSLFNFCAVKDSLQRPDMPQIKEYALNLAIYSKQYLIFVIIISVTLITFSVTIATW